MKKIKIVSVLIGLIFLGSCKDDFLSTVPTYATSTATAIATTDNAKLAINGLAKLLSRQWADSQGYNGEGTIKLYFGEYPGDGLYTSRTGWTNTMTLNNYLNERNLSLYYPWALYYMIISNANTIIANIDDATGPESERQYLKAQALTYRAYCYLMLIQLYSQRWVDSNNGQIDGVVLRLTPALTAEDRNLPLSSQASVYTQIYTDLQDAISLFEQSGYSRGDEFFEMDASVAHAIYARAAITRQDYTTAAAQAPLARTGHSLMTVNEYRAGFCNPNSEWIWGSWGSSDEPLYYYSYFAYIAYNSTASAVRNYPSCISREIYDRIPTTDIRRTMFAEPVDASEYNTATGQALTNSPLITRTRAAYPALASNALVFAYMQFKIATNDQPGVGNLNHIRSSEMYLIEAEAQYFLNNETGAQNLMNQLTRDSGRDPEYVCDATGTDLLNEIKFYRKVELWGEGFTWFDLKRWKDPLIRHTYADGGNYSATLAVTVEPNSNNNWTFVIPYKETNYNPAVSGNTE